MGLLKSICLERLEHYPDEVSSLEVLARCLDGGYKSLIEMELMKLLPDNKVHAISYLSKEFDLFSKKAIPDIDFLVIRLSRVITSELIEEKKSLLGDLIDLLNEYYVRDPVTTRDLVLALFRCLSQVDERFALTLFKKTRTNMRDVRINRAAFYSAKRTGRYILAFDLSTSFENKDEVDFERIKICQKIVDLLFSNEQEDLLIALEDIENSSEQSEKLATALRKISILSHPIFEYVSEDKVGSIGKTTFGEEIAHFCNGLREEYLTDSLFSVEGEFTENISEDLLELPLRHIRSRIKWESSKPEFEEKLISVYDNIDSDLINDRRLIEIVIGIADEVSSKFPNRALDFVSKHIKNRDSDERIVRLYAKICEKLGDLEDGISSLEECVQPSSIELLSRLKKYKLWIDEGYNLDYLGRTEVDYNPIPGNLMYNVHACLPFTTSGYTIRTKHVARALCESGLEVEVNARSGFPVDRNDFDSTAEIEKKYEDMGIRYSIDPDGTGLDELKDEEYCKRNADSILQRAISFQPSVIMAASDSSVGLSSCMVARHLGIPFIYEMRGIWAYTRAANYADFKGSTRFNLLLSLERQCSLSADLVVAISTQMKSLLISWGVDERKILIIPNGVTPLKQKREGPDGKREVGQEIVFGYIGSLVPYEGLNLLVDAAEILRKNGSENFRIKIAGGGISMGDLKQKIEDSDVSGFIDIVGRVPNEKINDFYSEVDIITIPRLSYEVTQLVPALKPLEAMEHGKCVICSDLEPNKELIIDQETGILFEENSAESLAEKMSFLVKNPGEIGQIGERGSQMVNLERGWDTLVLDLVGQIRRYNLLMESEKKLPDIRKMVDDVGALLESHEDLSADYASLEFDQIIAMAGKNHRAQRNVFLSFLRHIGTQNPGEACKFFSNSEELADKRSIRSVVTYSNRSGEYANSLFLLDKYGPMLDEKFVDDVSKVAGRHSERYSTAEDIPKIPILPDVRAKTKRNYLNVAYILDEFSYESFRYEANFIRLTKQNYLEVLGNGDIDFLFTESAWNGNDGEFVYGFTGTLTSNNAKSVREIIEVCNEYNIPTLFWNKEDPVNYDQFIQVAKLFDYILTSDSNCIEDYERDCPNSKISSLAFACQPTIHNPIRNTLPVMDLCFGGSWYVREHGRRKERLTSIVEGAEKFDLHIYDRNFGTDNRNKFPPRFSKFVKGKLTYSQMRMAYRIYEIMLNTNSVEGSPTMFSRRVFEIMASSTPVISTPSVGMEEMLPEAIVCEESKHVNEAVSMLLENEIQRIKLGHLGMRNVMRNHTYSHRMEEILAFLDIRKGEREPFEGRKLVSVVCCTNRPKMIENVMNNFNQQYYSNIEMVVMLQAKEEEFRRIKKMVEEDSRVKVRKQLKKDSLGKTFNKGLKYCKGDYIAKFDDDDLYGPNYISDSIDAFFYTDADVVGKYGVFVYDEKSGKYYLRNKGSSNRYLQIVMGATIIAKREIFDQIRFPDRTTGEDTEFLRRCISAKKKIYSSNPFNWVLVRRDEEGFHTWDDKGALTSGSSVEVNIDLEDVFI